MRTSQAIAAAGLRTFANIAGCWQLTLEQQARVLGFSHEAELQRLLGGAAPGLTDEQAERLSLVFGIWQALETLLPDAKAADGWIWRANAAPIFGGHPAARLLTSGRLDDLRALHAYVMSETN